MARIRIANPQEFKTALVDWATSPTNRANELIVFPGLVDMKDAQIDSFTSNAKMVIKVQADATDPFLKVTFVEKLT